MSQRAILSLEFTGYWISGTGAARGRDVDVVTHRDRDRLPAMPMTQIKGQLRETADRLAAGRVGPWAPPLVTKLFGSFAGDEDAPSKGGAVAFRGEARLPRTLRPWLAHKEQSATLARLFVRLPATAIGELGAALDHSLRTVEAVVPLTLEAVIEWDRDSPPTDWIDALDLAAAATPAFGKLKADGFGRAIAKVTAA